MANAKNKRKWFSWSLKAQFSTKSLGTYSDRSRYQPDRRYPVFNTEVTFIP